MTVRRALLRFSAALATAALIAAAPPPGALTSYLAPANRDATCPACKDFWRYANGGWLARNPIPSERSYWGIDGALDENNQALLRRALERAAAANAKPGTNDQLAGDYYAACMDQHAIDAVGAAPLRPELTRIDAIADLPGVVAEAARFASLGLGDAFVAFGPQADPTQSSRTIADIGQSGLSLPERDYYFRSDAATQTIRAAFVPHAQRLLVLAGESDAQAAADAATVMRVETALAKPQLREAELRDPKVTTHPYTLATLASLGKAVDWPAYFAAQGLHGEVAVNVDEPAYVAALETQLAATPVSDLKTYLRFHYVEANANALSTPFVDEAFAFSKLLSGAKQQLPRWKRCLRSTDAAMRDVIGQIFVAQAFPPSSKAAANAMVTNLRGTLRDDIAHLAWMSPATKVKAQRKLAAMVQKIGYPDRWRSYAGLTIARGDYFNDRLSANRLLVAYFDAKIGKPTDRGEWGMAPQLINAQYDPSNNDITFPAAILLPPYYDAADDQAMNYGSIGAVIGHEMTHGFDDEGRQYDAQGNLADWWTPADAKRFDARAQCIIDQFDRTVAVGTVHYEGKLDSGEAIADLGGAKIAYDAFERWQSGHPRRTIDGYTPEQRFFVAFAMSWAANQRAESARTQAQTDPHPLNRDRVLVTLENMPEFARAFHCKPGDGMVKPAGTLCRIW